MITHQLLYLLHQRNLNEFSKLVQKDLQADGKNTDKQIKEQVSKFLSNKKSNTKEKNNPFVSKLICFRIRF